MNQGMPLGERQLRAFEESLTKLLGAENFPREALGDLSALLDELRRGVRLLKGLMELRQSFERQPAAKLHELEMVLDDVRKTLRDLLPSLRKITRTAYSMSENSTEEEQVKQAKRLLNRLSSLELKQDAQSDTGKPKRRRRGAARPATEPLR